MGCLPVRPRLSKAMTEVQPPMRASKKERTARPRVPGQRSPVGGVAVMVSARGCSTALLHGARAAHDRGVPLELLLPHVSAQDKATCFAVMDQAVLDARKMFPGLEVRVHVGEDDLSFWLQCSGVPVDLVFLSKAEAALLASSEKDPEDPERMVLSLPGCRVVVV